MHFSKPANVEIQMIDSCPNTLDLPIFASRRDWITLSSEPAGAAAAAHAALFSRS
jgi:hypothetical protein